MARAPAACGGGRGRGRAPLSPLLGCLLVVVVALRAAVCRAQEALPALEVATYNYTSFQSDGSSSNSHELALSRDARIYQGALQVSPDTGNAASYQAIMANKSGSVLLRRRFTIWRHLTVGNGSAVQVASFNTTFSINVFHLPASSPRPGEGITFVVAPSLADPPPASFGGFLGLTNATLDPNAAAAGNTTTIPIPPTTTTANRKFVAVEFDTVKQFYDPSDNHVGLNVGSVVSAKTTDLTAFRIATDSADPRNYTVWVEYSGAARHVAVFMAVQGDPKPASPVLASPLDLSQHVPEQAYLGFTASTGADFELNCVLDWSLSIEVIPEKKRMPPWVVVLAVAVPVVAAAVAVAAFFVGRRMRARRAMERRQERLQQQLSNLAGMPRGFAYDVLKKATGNFDERLSLGKGGYGMVYKGVLPSAAGEDDGGARPDGGMDVAVKRFTRDDGRDVNDFLQEVDIISRLRHKNIVPLIGWCYKNGQLLLVYEYMPNGSLDQHLFRRGGGGDHSQRPPVLSWARRYAIVGDVAAGLHYVHHEHTRMVLHRDIKASNVLLDAAWRARLGDFGLARVLDHGRESFTDAGVAGTRGFIAPEYSIGHRASRETDVFAFGALVLEVVTGRPALGAAGELLSDWAWRMHGRGALLGAVDQGLAADEFDHGEAARLLLLALACSSPNPRDRPGMPRVMQVLAKAAPPPDVPAFKPQFVWPPEGGVQFHLSDIEVSTTTSGIVTGAGDGGAGGSTRATQSTSYDSFQSHTAPNSSDGYFPALSSGR